MMSLMPACFCIPTGNIIYINLRPARSYFFVAPVPGKALIPPLLLLTFVYQFIPRRVTVRTFVLFLFLSTVKFPSNPFNKKLHKAAVISTKVKVNCG